MGWGGELNPYRLIHLTSPPPLLPRPPSPTVRPPPRPPCFKLVINGTSIGDRFPLDLMRIVLGEGIAEGLWPLERLVRGAMEAVPTALSLSLFPSSAPPQGPKAAMRGTAERERERRGG